MKQKLLTPLQSNEEIVVRNGKTVVALKTQTADKAILPIHSARDIITYWNTLSSNAAHKLCRFLMANKKTTHKSSIAAIKGLNALEDGHFFDSERIVWPESWATGGHVVTALDVARPVDFELFKSVLDKYLLYTNRTRKTSLYKYLFGNAFGPESGHFGSPFVTHLYKFLYKVEDKPRYVNPGQYRDYYKYIYWFMESVIGLTWQSDLDRIKPEDFAERFFTKQHNKVSETERPYITYDPSKWIMYDPFIKAIQDSWGDKKIPVFYFLSDTFFEFLSKYADKSDH